jgi:uncharacterized protein (DUF2252 family)
MNTWKNPNAMIENAPRPARERGAVAVARRRGETTAGLALAGPFGASWCRGQTCYWNAGANSLGADAAAEVARIYFPQ